MKTALPLIIIIGAAGLTTSCGPAAEAPKSTQSDEYDDYSPAWSPDGSKIMFGSTRTGNRDLFVMNGDGTNDVQLTFEEGVDWAPAWSPDGTRIAFCSDRDGSQDVFVMNADGTDPERLTDHPKLIRRVYEIDPLLCPFCGAEMKILAFITDFATARAIRRSLKLPAQEPEPLAHGPPHEIELLDQIAHGPPHEIELLDQIA
jgi:hypothetical protein